MNDTTNLDTLKMYIKMLEDENRNLRERVSKFENEETEHDQHKLKDEEHFKAINYKDIMDCISKLDVEMLIVYMNDPKIPQEIRGLCTNRLVKEGYDLSLF